MDISKSREGNLLTVTLAGELNASTTSELEGALRGDVHEDDTVVFDIADLIYITSAGLRIFATCDKATGGRRAVVLRGASEEVREVLAVTRFDTILVVE